MSRIAYVNGRYVPHRQAAVHIEDRGYQFSDGIYEVIWVAGGKFVDLEPHLERLERSLRELSIAVPMSRAALSLVMTEVVRRNAVRSGIIYVQMTRGVAARDHAFPAKCDTQIVMTAKNSKPQARSVESDGVKAVSLPDIRWARCDIKSVSLLPNVLAKQAARSAGAYEALFVDDDGRITEGSSSNVWIVTRDGELVTRASSTAILTGVTRRTLFEIAAEQGLRLVERPFTLAEAKAARETFVTSTTSFVMPITQIDDTVVANGKPGSVTLGLRQRYLDHMAAVGAA